MAVRYSENKMDSLKPLPAITMSPEMRSVLEGRPKNLPASKSSQIRVFFSSTFTDMAVERNTLMKDVIPYLTEICKQQGYEFEVVDMRWGVRDEAQVDQTTSDLLLREIKQCQTLSAGPNFVMFLGDRYGSHMLPTQIKSSEFKTLKICALDMDLSLLEKWYVLDMNSEPPVYHLQPITKYYPDYNNLQANKQKEHEKAREDWQRTEKQLLSILQHLAKEALSKKKINLQQYEKYFESVTEMEIRAGALDASTTDKVFCFQRNFTSIDLQDKLAGRYIDLTESREIDLLAKEQRDKLQNEKVPKALPADQIFKSTIPWTDKGVNPLYHKDYLTNLCETFQQTMLDKINKCLAAESRVSKDELYFEVLRNLYFCVDKCKIFYGREAELELIREKSLCLFSETSPTEDPEKEEGEKTERSHTSSEKEENDDDDDDDDGDDDDESHSKQLKKEHKAIAKKCKSLGVKFHYGDAYDDVESDPRKNPQLQFIRLPQMPQFRRPVIVHGCSGSGKTALMSEVGKKSAEWMPDSFCVMRYLGTSPQCIYIRDILIGLCHHISKLYNVCIPSYIDLESEFQFLVSVFHSLLWKIDTQTHPLIIILDSVDQLHPSDHAHSMSWIPKKLPPNVSMVISMLPAIHNCLHNSKASFPFPDQYVELSDFSPEDAAEVIKMLCNHSNRCLTRQQTDGLLKMFVKHPQPLFLKLIVDEGLTWTSYTQLSDVHIGETVEDAINHLFDKLEHNHGDMLVTHALSYLCAASEGLSDAEMEDLLSLDDEVLQDTYLYHLPPDSSVIRLPPLLWKRIADDLREYIVQKKSGNWFVLTWYHRQFREVAKQRFLPPDKCISIHSHMSEYFMGVWHEKAKPLELFKIKKGQYPNATRRVPEQSLVFDKGGYNMRKLIELPHHLIRSQNFKQFRETACSFQWMFAKCKSLSVSAVIEDIRMALESLTAEDEIRDDIKFISDLLALGTDSIRKDTRNLAVQIVGQIDVDVITSSHLLTMFRDAHDWLVTNDNPQLVPQNVCLPRPGGVLTSSVNVDVHIQGSDRDFNNCMVFDENEQKLIVIQQQSHSRHDNLHVYEVQDNITCIQINELPFNVRAVDLVGNNRFLLLQVYDKMDKYSPEYHCEIFEGTTSSTPVSLTVGSTVMNVSNSGKFLVYGKDNTVNIAHSDKSNSFTNKHSLDTEDKIGHLIISPNEQYVITISTKYKQLLWETKTGDKLKTLAESGKDVQSFENFAPNKRNCMITTSNIYIHRGWSYTSSSLLFCYQLPSGDQLGICKSNSTHYQMDLVELDKKEEFVLYGTSASVVINTDMKKNATVTELSTRRVVSVCNCVNGPYSDLKFCGEEELFVVAAVSHDPHIYIMSVGLRTALRAKAELMFQMSGHSQGVLQIIISSNENVMLSAAEDNSIKLWNFKKIMDDIKNKNAASPERVSCYGNKKKVDVEDLQMKLEKMDEDSAVERLGKTLSLIISSKHGVLYMATAEKFLLKRNLKDKSRVVLDVSLDEPASEMLLSKNDQYLCVMSGEEIIVLDTSSDKLLYRLEGRGKIASMAEGGNVLVAGTSGMEAKGRIWSLETGTKIRDFEFLYSLSKVAINSSGTKMCVTLFDYPVILNVEDHGTDNPDIDHSDTMMYSCISMAINSDDSLAAAGSSDGTTRVISVQTGKYLFRLNQRSSVITLAFAPNNHSLLTAGYRSIYVWDMHDGHLECKLTRHNDFVVNIKFTTDGRFMVTSGRDKMIVIWNMDERVSVCVFLAHCHLDVLDVASDLSYIAYGPEVTAVVSVLEPNTVLKSMVDGSYVKAIPDPVKKAQSLALSFSAQKVKSETTSVCDIL